MNDELKLYLDSIVERLDVIEENVNDLISFKAKLTGLFIGASLCCSFAIEQIKDFLGIKI